METTWLLEAACVYVVVVLRSWMFPQQQYYEPMRMPGLLGLGSTLAFAIYGADVLIWASSRAQHAFQISLMFQSYVFLTSPEAVKSFTSAPASALALEPAVSHFTAKCFGLSDAMWHRGEAVPAQALRQLLLPQHVDRLSPRMADALAELAPQYMNGSGGQALDLAYALPRWVMHATVVVLFGPAFVSRVPIAALLSAFIEFDDFFEVRTRCRAE